MNQNSLVLKRILGAEQGPGKGQACEEQEASCCWRIGTRPCPFPGAVPPMKPKPDIKGGAEVKIHCF